MNARSSIVRRSVAIALAALLPTSLLFSAPAADKFLGHWALTLPGGGAGWLEIKAENGWLDGSILWGGGSVVPVGSVVIEEDTLTVTRMREVVRRDAAGTIVRRQQFADVITARSEGNTLQLLVVAARNDGAGFDRNEFTGRRIPALPPRPDLAKVKLGEPIPLFNGRDLTGWRLLEPQAANGWVVESGVLGNRPVQIEGQPPKRYGNLRTEREFEDFNIQLEVNIPVKSNSGVYLRGIYEVQVQDSYGKPLDAHNMGAIYSRITPVVAAEKPAGEWQTLDVTLLDRHVTVRLNGTTIINNQPLAGCTGGALWSDEFRPGPIYLQGDHGPVEYRNIVLRPVVK
jgi:hypothetical protein